MLPVKLITFDVTGTLLFFRTPILEKYQATGLRHGISADSATLSKNFSTAWRTLNAEHPNFGRDTGLGWENWWVKFVEITFTGARQSEDAKFRQIAEDLLAFHTTPNAFDVRPGTNELLTYLKNRRIRLGVISNYDGRLNAVLECVDLKKHFDFVLGSYDFGHAKPDRRIFEEALKLGRCSTGAESIHIGDDVDLDYQGAKRTGMRAILMTDDARKWAGSDVSEADTFKDFFAVKKHLETIK